MPDKEIPVVILCGGKGARMGVHSQFLPKGLIPIGEKPILWHIMKIYSYFGFNQFILCLGYQGAKIREYFKDQKQWQINFVDTGLDTNTGGRIKAVERYIKQDTFFATYGDGLSDVNINQLLHYHSEHKKIATLLAVKPYSQFGIIEFSDSHSSAIKSFVEKPLLDHWINGGFFVFQREIFNYIEDNDVLEKEVFTRLVKKSELIAHKHHGFWKCMDTYKDCQELNNLWQDNKASWEHRRR